jgi:hypothetical protein
MEETPERAMAIMPMSSVTGSSERVKGGRISAENADTIKVSTTTTMAAITPGIITVTTLVVLFQIQVQTPGLRATGMPFLFLASLKLSSFSSPRRRRHLPDRLSVVLS